jgi:hypothetical protein
MNSTNRSTSAKVRRNVKASIVARPIRSAVSVRP